MLTPRGNLGLRYTRIVATLSLSAWAVGPSCTGLYIDEACRADCNDRNDRCLLQAMSTAEVRRCDQETAACVAQCG